LKALCDGERFAASLAHLERLCGLLAQTPYAAHIRLDFSIVNDMRYYNGFVFRGWLPGLPEGILAGGQYDNLLSRLGKSGGAVGFAVYLDLLEQYCRADEPDTDILLIYDDTTDPLTLQKAVRELSADGSRVTAQRDVPQKLRFGRRLSIREGRVCTDG
ncbi:MAG: ATP phosphoribosyltransferase regulatory subunit, partial [Clostridia bacterium]|nr:ATP phosphoribosyltransferase regulatory subunit [Clostridia bacterium]